MGLNRATATSVASDGMRASAGSEPARFGSFASAEVTLALCTVDDEGNDRDLGAATGLFDLDGGLDELVPTGNLT